MEIFVLRITGLIASLLTFFTVFGLGAILTPVFAIFFAVDLAIVLTSVVHFLKQYFQTLSSGLALG